jgi:hypothetical protein
MGATAASCTTIEAQALLCRRVSFSIEVHMIKSVLLVPAILAAAPWVARAQGTQPSGSADSTPIRPTPAQHHQRTTSSSNGSVSDTTNQTQSGVVNGKTGSSTLGPRIKHATPTQGQAVTAKGDTLNSGSTAGDTTGATTSHRRSLRSRSDSSTRDSSGKSLPRGTTGARNSGVSVGDSTTSSTRLPHGTTTPAATTTPR